MRSFFSGVVKRFIISVAAGSLAVVTACGGPTRTTPTNGSAESAGTPADGCVTDYAPGRDYFPDKVSLKYAKNFSVTYHDSYQMVTVEQPAAGQPAEKYVFYRCGTPIPELTGDLAGAQTVSVPINSLFSGSSTHLSPLEDLDELGVLTGVSNGSFITNPRVQQMVAAGKVVEYAQSTIDTELVISSDPEVAMTGGTDDPAYPVIRQAGIPVVANAEWLEESPLGRAEWIKFMAALTGAEARATNIFDRIELDYRRVADKARSTGAPVAVLPGQMYEGNWSMPGGGSYVATLLKDANGTYAWSNTDHTGSLTLSLEDVLARAQDAAVWIMGADVRTLADITGVDPRSAEFAAFRQGKVWSNNAKVTARGANDYWERGVTRPDLVLADLVEIMHPGEAPEHEFEFYRKVTR